MMPFRIAGFVLVLRQRVRRTVRQDLAGVAGLLTLLLGVSGLLETQPPHGQLLRQGMSSALVPFWVGTGFYLATVPDFLLRWLMMYLFGAAVVLLPLSALLGARAMPERREAQATQEALLTHLTAYEITLARLLANLVPVLGALGGSCLFWLLTCLLHRTGDANLVGASFHFQVGATEIVGAHSVLVCAAFMVGAVGALFASSTKVGAWWGRGALAGMVLAVFSMGDLVLLDGVLVRLDNPVPWINGLLLLNPIAAIASLLRVDLLRTEWLYQHTQANEYPFSYPNSLLAVVVWLGIGGIAVCGAGLRLRIAYREGSRLFFDSVHSDSVQKGKVQKGKVQKGKVQEGKSRGERE